MLRPLGNGITLRLGLGIALLLVLVIALAIVWRFTTPNSSHATPVAEGIRDKALLDAFHFPFRREGQ